MVGPGAPLLAIIHGLTGCEDSLHVRATSRHFLEHGYPVLRMNLRGSLPSRPTSSGHYHAGRSEDIAAMFAQIDGFPHIVAMGVSLGGNVLLKHLGEAGDGTRLGAAIAVSVPLDLSTTSRRMQEIRNRFYHNHVLTMMKQEATAAGARLSDAERLAIEGAATVRDFDDRFIAPRFGFEGADDYYRRNSAVAFLDGIRCPTLMVHGRDDPWIPVALYEAHDWSRNPNLNLLLSDGGGHVGFHGRGDSTPWHDRCALRFVESQFGR